MDQWSREPACQSGPDVARETFCSTCSPRVVGNNTGYAATSSDARLRRPVRVTVLRRADVCAFELGSAPRKHAPPQAVHPRRPMGAWVLIWA